MGAIPVANDMLKQPKPIPHEQNRPPPQPLWNHYHSAHCLVNNWDPCPTGVCAIPEPYHRAKTAEAISYQTMSHIVSPP